MSPPVSGAPEEGGADRTGRASSEGDALMQAAGVRRISVPTPFRVGTVNAYLIEDEPLTLIDSGPDWATALEALEAGLAACGHRVENLGLILITHQHVDHMGLAQLLARRAGAEVACLDLLASYIENYDASVTREDDLRAATMQRHGISADVVVAVRSAAVPSRRWASRTDVDRRLADGASLRLRDRNLRVLHRPGHSPTDTLFWDADRRLLIGGDHLLASVSSNALVDPPLSGVMAGATPRPLLDYRRSLRATRELDAEVVLGGHGSSVMLPGALIDSRLQAHEERAEQLLRLLGDGAHSGRNLALGLFGDAAVAQPFLTLSEVLGHLDLLVERGAVVADEDADPVRFLAR